MLKQWVGEILVQALEEFFFDHLGEGFVSPTHVFECDVVSVSEADGFSIKVRRMVDASGGVLDNVVGIRDSMEVELAAKAFETYGSGLMGDPKPKLIVVQLIRAALTEDREDASNALYFLAELESQFRQYLIRQVFPKLGSRWVTDLSRMLADSRVFAIPTESTNTIRKTPKDWSLKQCIVASKAASEVSSDIASQLHRQIPNGLTILERVLPMRNLAMHGSIFDEPANRKLFFAPKALLDLSLLLEAVKLLGDLRQLKHQPN